jgi:uncharacterized protein YdaU (DUF1376 family)
MKHYPHHIRDFNNATRHLSRIERSIYRDLIDLYYETEARLTMDLLSLCRRILANECSTDVERVLNEFFTETATGWYHDRCEQEIEAYQGNTSQRAAAGKASAEKKRLKKQQALNENSTSVERALNERSNSVERDANEISQPINQSTNQPINQLKEAKASKKADAFVLPDWINKNDWSLWQKSRSGKKMIPEQMAAQVEKLDAWRKAGIDFEKALKNSAENGWSGLFDPKPNQKNIRDGPEKKSFAQIDEEAAQLRYAEAIGSAMPIARPETRFLEVISGNTYHAATSLD